MSADIISNPVLVNLSNYSNDVVTVDVDVLFSPDQEVTSLSGATATFRARNRNGGAVINGSTSVNVPNNRVRGSFPADTFSEGVYNIQLQVNIGGNVKTLVAGTLKIAGGIS